MTRIYLSARFEDGLQLWEVRAELVARGCDVTARWLDTASGGAAVTRADEEGAAARLAGIARQDIEDIERAEVVAVFNPAEACGVGRGGRHVETGYALALGKRVVVVGARGNVFHWLPEVVVVDDWPAFYALLPGLHAANATTA